MTVTLVYGDATDGYLSSSDPAYATARTGPADNLDDNFTSAFFGQTTGYTIHEAFIRFAAPALAAGELVTTAAIRTTQATATSTGVTRDLELRGFDWGASVALADWRTPTQLSALTLHARVTGVQAAAGKTTYAGSDDLRALLQSGGVAAFVAVSSRQRAGSTPTVDERGSFYAAERSGTTEDPCLIYTTTQDHGLVPVLGASVQLSDGTWAYLATGAGVVTLHHKTATGAATLVATLNLGTGTSEWADVAGAQGLALVVDSADNLFVTGRAGNAGNSLRHRAYIKGAGYTWTAGTIRTLPLPAHDGVVNNVAAAWTSAGGGTIVVLAGHAASDGVPGGDPNDVSYALLNSQYLLDGVTGTQNRGTGSAVGLSLLPPSLPSASDFSGYTNEAGTGLDVVIDHDQPDWGYLVSYHRGQRLGDNGAVAVGRFKLNSTAGGFDHSSWSMATAYGRKDAGGKVRILSTGPSQVALVSADADTGYGLTLQALQSSGTTPGWVNLGVVNLAGESIPTMPDGPAVGGSAAWDAIYSSAENAVWVYYVDAADSARVMRTSVDLDTYQATRTEAEVVAAAGGAVRALRTPRNAWVAQRSHLSVARLSGATEVADHYVDTLNQPPLAPTLTPRFNFDATLAATFAWAFQDPNAGDAQSAYQLQVERVSDGVTVLDTGKVASSTQSHAVAGGTLANGVDYRWRVTTWDALDTAGPWSDYGAFSTSASGTVTITDPATDNPPGIITNDYLVTWSVAGTVQANFRVWVTRNDTGVTVHDSFLTAGTQTTWLVTDMVSDVEHTVHVLVSDASGVATNTATRLITPSYGTPEVPLVTVTPVHDSGYVLVDVDNPLPQGDRPDVVRNRVLRRRAGSLDLWEVLGECEPSGSFRDYTVPSQVPVEYMVRGESA